MANKGILNRKKIYDNVESNECLGTCEQTTVFIKILKCLFYEDNYRIYDFEKCYIPV